MILHSEVDYMKEIEDKSVEVGVVRSREKKRAHWTPSSHFSFWPPRHPVVLIDCLQARFENHLIWSRPLTFQLKNRDFRS